MDFLKLRLPTQLKTDKNDIVQGTLTFRAQQYLDKPLQ